MRLRQFGVLGGVIALTLAACSGQSGGDPGAAVKDYLQALADKQPDKIGALVCAEYETDARTEFDSFGAVTAALDNVTCKQNGTDGADALVTCTGAIQVNYTGETRPLELKDNVYRVRQNNGKWQMCGYK